MFEIIKKASRFSDDEPEVIDHADSLSEAEALAHDYQVNRYGPSAFVTIRRAGERGSAGAVTDSDLRISYHYMSIEGLEGQRFLVAKLRRISSPPVQLGSVSDSMGSTLGRLVDIVRLGKNSRNFIDLKEIEMRFHPDWMVSAESEWEAYYQELYRVKEVERLESLSSTEPKWLGRESAPELRVAYHYADMNERPYLVARVGQIFGSPAPILLVHPHQQASALFRLLDQFRIGDYGQCYKDFLEGGLKIGKTERDIRTEWLTYEQAVLSDRYMPQAGN